MKHLAGTVLLIFSPMLTGCGQQDPAGAGSNPAPTERIPEGLDERHAANFLAMARDLQKDGESEQAIELLNELLTLYPKSDAADQAKQILTDLEKRSFRTADVLGDYAPGATVTVRGVLRHFPQDVKSIKAWLGHEFLVDETPIRANQNVTRDVLLKMVGQSVQVTGIWNAGEKWEPPTPDDEEFELQTPSYPEGVTIVTGAGIEASSVKQVEE